MVIALSQQREDSTAQSNIKEALALIAESRDRARAEAQRAGSLEDAGAWMNISSGLTMALLTLRADSPVE